MGRRIRNIQTTYVACARGALTRGGHSRHCRWSTLRRFGDCLDTLGNVEVASQLEGLVQAILRDVW